MVFVWFVVVNVTFVGPEYSFHTTVSGTALV
jgi:hypothetical protein